MRASTIAWSCGFLAYAALAGALLHCSGNTKSVASKDAGTDGAPSTDASGSDAPNDTADTGADATLDAADGDAPSADAADTAVDAPDGEDGGPPSDGSSEGATPEGGESGIPCDPLHPCTLSLSCCSGSCVDTSSDPRNCGGCGVVCSATQFCAKGSSEAGTL